MDKIEEIADLQAKRTNRRYRDIAELDDKSGRTKTLDEVITSFDRMLLLEEAVNWYGLLMSGYRSGVKLHSLPKRTARNIKYFYQRGRRGYSEADTWNLYHYLSRTIADSLEDLRDNAHGYPSLKEWDDLSPEECYAQWQRELTMMAEGFRHVTKDMDNTVDEQTWKKFQYFFKNLWD